MKTKTIFKTLALAMLMPTMLLTTACSSDDNEIVNTENPTNTKGYALPVTVNVTRQGEDATTRATYNDNGDGTGSLAFSAGDKLFVMGDHTGAGQFAGTLDYDAVSGKFSGTVYTQNSYEGTADALFTAANDVRGILLPADYESYGAFSIVGSGYEANFNFDFKKGFAPTKAAAVEQFSLELTFSYSSGFALAPMFALASFTISGLTANKKVEVSFDTDGAGVISGNVTTSAEGVATFAIGVFPGSNLEDCTLTVDGNNIALPTKEAEAGKIYNISRSAKAHALSTSVVGEIVGSDGMAYAVADKDKMPSGVTAAGMVAYKNGSNGLVIALADEANTMNWSTATGASGAAAHTPVVTGGTWKLPSKAEWNQMFGYDADADIANYFNLNTAISTAGGTELQDGLYWSSTEFEDGIAYEVELDLGSAYWHNNGDEDDAHCVRACLAF